MLGPLLAVDPGLRLGRSWDLAAVHRVLHGGHRAEPADVWCHVRGLEVSAAPRSGQLDLLGADASAWGAAAPSSDDDGAPDEPVRPDGHLRPDWAAGAWGSTPQRARRWAALALEVAGLQLELVREVPARGSALHGVYAESAADLVAVELGATGLPVDLGEAERLIGEVAGRRPTDEADERRIRAERDRLVLDTVPDDSPVDLRSPLQVKELLRRNGFDLPDTRSWRLEQLAGTHPLVDALLQWRKGERIATTYGYRWLDHHLGADGRLRGTWTGSDGGAGRMTASAGLHSMPRELRPAVVAEPGHLLVRADLGQVEPRVLAAISRDRDLARAAASDDLYADVAAALRCERPVAKVAVLAAMYGQTSGTAADALRDMERAYPTAMRFLQSAAQRRQGRSRRAHLGRATGPDVAPRPARARRRPGGRARPPVGPGRARTVRAQRRRPGLGRRAVQGLDGHGARPAEVGGHRRGGAVPARRAAAARARGRRRAPAHRGGRRPAEHGGPLDRRRRPVRRRRRGGAPLVRRQGLTPGRRTSVDVRSPGQPPTTSQRRSTPFVLDQHVRGSTSADAPLAVR